MSAEERAKVCVRLGGLIKQDLEPQTFCGHVGSFITGWATFRANPAIRPAKLTYERMEQYATEFVKKEKSPLNAAEKKAIRLEHLVVPIVTRLQVRLPKHIGEDYTDFGGSAGREFLDAMNALITRLENSDVKVKGLTDEAMGEFVNHLARSLCCYNKPTCREAINPYAWFCISRKAITPARLRAMTETIVDNWEEAGLRARADTTASIV